MQRAYGFVEGREHLGGEPRIGGAVGIKRVGRPTGRVDVGDGQRGEVDGVDDHPEVDRGVTEMAA